MSICKFSGLEVFVQISVQVLLLLLSETKTATTGGLETIFNQKFLGLDAYTVLCLSIAWSLISIVRVHMKLISLQKGFCKMTSKMFIFVWGTFAALRRVLSIIAVFIPSLGLFSILHHWRWEQIPFRFRQDYVNNGFTISPDDKVALYGLNETIYWSDLDRWTYSVDPFKSTPPPYSLYTLLSLKETLLAASILLFLHILIILIVKIMTSPDFRKRGGYTDKIIHAVECTHYAQPYSDWDEGESTTILEFRARLSDTVKEMAATFAVNIVVTGIMMIPLWHTGNYNSLNA